MRIALEEHFTINHPEHIDRWRSMVPQVPREIADKAVAKFTDVGDRRLEEMSKAGIDLAVLSNIGLVQSVLDPHVALRLSKEANDYLASVVQRIQSTTRGLPPYRCKSLKREPTSSSER